MRETAKVLAFVGVLIGIALVCGPRQKTARAANGDVPTPSSNVVEVYIPDSTASALRTNLSTADVAVLGSTFNAASTPFVCGSTSTHGAKQALTLQPRFASSGDTCKVRICYYSSTSASASPFLVSSEITFTGSTTIKDAAGKYYATDPYTFDSMGALEVRVNLTTAGAGNVDLWMGSR